MPEIDIPEKLGKLLDTPKRFKIIYGGRGGAKSMSIADILLIKAQSEGLKIGCFREFQNSIEDSVYSLLVEEVRRLGLQGFSSTTTSIYGDGFNFKFGGLARNPDSIKSKHGFNIFWIEEAQTISYKSLEILTPTLRESGSECWLTLNPGSSADPVSERFLKPYQKELDANGYYEDDTHLIIEINYPDNPWFPKELEAERVSDYDRLNRAEYDHKWLGKYNDSVDKAIIKPEWFDAAIDAHIKLGFEPVGQIVAAHDPSDLGNDPKGYALRQGSVFLDIDEKTDGDVNEGAKWALDKAILAGADVFTWDGDGLGAALRQQVTQALEGKKIAYVMFKGSEAPEDPDDIYLPGGVEDEFSSRTNKQTFKNKRAQYSWKLRDRFYNTYRAVEKKEYIDPDTMVSLSSSITKLKEIRAETCRIPQKDNANGLIQILSKPEMLKLGIASPNMFDCKMMSMLSGVERPKARKLKVRI